MKKQSYGRDIGLILLFFVISRVLASLFGIHLEYDALFKYWQYLDVETLRHNLLRGIWYDHAQPPFFNLLLGIVLKCSGSYSPLVFSVVLKTITLINSILLLVILKRLTRNGYIPVLLSLLYLLSPALMIFESELFYTTFISMLLLLSAFFLMHLEEKLSWNYISGFFLPLVVLCLTRSMYHLLWLAVAGAIILFYYRKRNSFNKLLVGFIFSLLLVGGWYVKNYIIFDQFSTSSWMGMNMARNVFHDHPVADSSRIEALEPFSPISRYKPFLSGEYKKKYAGLNDRDLLKEVKNDSFTNENHIDYIEVSKKYSEASRKYIESHPGYYLKNVLQSCIIFFAPATRYSHAETQAAKIKYYDVIYSFNLSHFAKGKQQRRIALTVSAMPRLIIYCLVFFFLIRDVVREKDISSLNLFIIATIGFVFFVSSLVEHYENMRFRYEIEPLFLILLGQVIHKISLGMRKDHA